MPPRQRRHRRSPAYAGGGGSGARVHAVRVAARVATLLLLCQLGCDGARRRAGPRCRHGRAVVAQAELQPLAPAPAHVAAAAGPHLLPAALRAVAHFGSGRAHFGGAFQQLVRYGSSTARFSAAALNAALRPLQGPAPAARTSFQATLPARRTQQACRPARVRPPPGPADSRLAATVMMAATMPASARLASAHDVPPAAERVGRSRTRLCRDAAGFELVL